MVKRISYRSYFYIAFALMIMMFCWESNQIQAAVVDSTIPQDSIRIRILANSDSVQDQWIKREVQQAVVKEISGWVLDPTSLDEARTEIRANIPALEEAVGRVLVVNGYNQTYTVELGQVPFPAKEFGDKVYPAGDYEALRIVLGSGQGQNWWCVLFPPLCFVGVKAKAAAAPAPTPAAQAADKAAGAGSGAGAGGKDAKDAKDAQATKKTDKPAQTASASVKPAASTGKAETAAKATVQPAGKTAAAANEVNDDEAASKPEVKFFVWEIAKKIGGVFKSLFA